MCSSVQYSSTPASYHTDTDRGVKMLRQPYGRFSAVCGPLSTPILHTHSPWPCVKTASWWWELDAGMFWGSGCKLWHSREWIWELSFLCQVNERRKQLWNAPCLFGSWTVVNVNTRCLQFLIPPQAAASKWFFRHTEDCSDILDAVLF